MDYILRDIDRELWIKIKHLCLDEKINIRQLIMILLRQYVEKTGTDNSD